MQTIYIEPLFAVGFPPRANERRRSRHQGRYSKTAGFPFADKDNVRVSDAESDDVSSIYVLPDAIPAMEPTYAVRRRIIRRRIGAIRGKLSRFESATINISCMQSLIGLDEGLIGITFRSNLQISLQVLRQDDQAESIIVILRIEELQKMMKAVRSRLRLKKKNL